MFSFFQEAAVRASEVSAAVRALDVTVGQTQHHPCDLSSAQAEAVLPIFEDVSEVKTSDMNVTPSWQIDISRSKAPHHPAIFSGPPADGYFETDSSAGCGAAWVVSLLPAILQCLLTNQPLFSLRQTEGTWTSSR